MSDPDDLLTKFKNIAALVSQDKWEEADKIFKAIEIDDFPVVSESTMRHSIIARPDDVLYLIKHGWGDPNWSPYFINEVVEALKSWKELHK